MKLYAFILFIVLLSPNVFANHESENIRLRMYFGLSLPTGGAVSLEQWKKFESEEITQFFDGFNVVDSVGYYKGKSERSKILTIILKREDLVKAKELAQIYVERFNQESVMMVSMPVEEWIFVSKGSTKKHHQKLEGSNQ